MKKRALFLLMAAVMLLTVISPAASAASFDIETIVKPQYEAVGSFGDDLAAVKKDGKWGYIDEDGDMVIKPQFDYAGQFSEGVAVVAYKHTDEYGSEYFTISIVDKDGNVTDLKYLDNFDMVGEMIPVEYWYDESLLIDEAATWFCQNGVINVAGNPFTADGEYIMPKGDMAKYDVFEMIGPCIGGVIAMRAYYVGSSDMQAFYMDKDGNVTRVFDATPDSNGYSIVSVYAPEQDRIIYWYGGYDEEWNWVSHCGAMDMNGNVVIEPEYSGFRYLLSGRFFCDGLWTVQNDNGKYGAVDKDGNAVIPFEYDFLGSFTEGMAVAKKDGESFYIDPSNKRYEVGGIDGGTAIAESASQFTNGVAAVYVSADGEAYCVQNVIKDGVVTAIPGTEQLGKDVYFPGHVEGSDDYGTIYGLSDIIAIVENGKWGFAKLDFTLDLPDESAMDSWAYDEVCKAIEAGLVPNELQNQYKSNITRSDFALLFMEVASEITGKSVEELVKSVTGEDLDELVKNSPFTDTNDSYIVAANALGIINGYGDGKFGPYDTITRQDAATLVLRAAVAIKADAMDVWGDKLEAANIEFNDGEDFADYAREAIQVMAALDVMKGTGNNEFSPKATYTRQQSFMTAYRLMTQIVEAE